MKEGCIMEIERKWMVKGLSLIHIYLHRQQVVVDGNVGSVEDGSQLMLAGSNFVVLGLGGNAQLPQLLVQLLHKFGDLGTDDTEVMLLQLLTLGRGSTEQSAAGEDQILTCLVAVSYTHLGSSCQHPP